MEDKTLKRKLFALLLLAAALLACACARVPEPSAEERKPQETQEPREPQTGVTGEDPAETEEKDPAAEEPQALSAEEIEAAKQAALDYYAATVFEVNTITFTERGSRLFADGECNFTVSVSKDGAVQEPDRVIALERDGDAWIVVNEGW